MPSILSQFHHLRMVDTRPDSRSGSASKVIFCCQLKTASLTEWSKTISETSQLTLNLALGLAVVNLTLLRIGGSRSHYPRMAPDHPRSSPYRDRESIAKDLG